MLITLCKKTPNDMSYGILFNAHGLVNKSHLTILVLFKGCFFFLFINCFFANFSFVSIL